MATEAQALTPCQCSPYYHHRSVSHNRAAAPRGCASTGRIPAPKLQLEGLGRLAFPPGEPCRFARPFLPLPATTPPDMRPSSRSSKLCKPS